MLSIVFLDNNTCNRWQFRCDSGQCISASGRCDRWYHCTDRSDERNCSKYFLSIIPVLSTKSLHTVIVSSHLTTAIIYQFYAEVVVAAAAAVGVVVLVLVVVVAVAVVVVVVIVGVGSSSSSSGSRFQ